MKFHASCVFVFLAILSCSERSREDSRPLLTVTPVNIGDTNFTISFCEELTGGKLSPAIEYYTTTALHAVKSTSPGVVTRIDLNEGVDDYEVQIKFNDDWIIIYDHVKNITVSVGDHIEAGTVIGKVGVGNRVELQLNKHNLSYCPINFGSAEFVNLHESKKQIDWCLCENVKP